MVDRATQDGPIGQEDLVSLATYIGVETVDPVAVVAPTRSGVTARLITRFRLPIWTFAFSPSVETCQQLLFTYGVYPVHETAKPDMWEAYAREWLNQRGMNVGAVLLTQGTGTLDTGGTNQLAIVDLSAGEGLPQ
jgi:pyruvate kinase